MIYRMWVICIAVQKADIWDRWKRGKSLNSIGLLFDRPFSSILNMFVTTGGIRLPSWRNRLAASSVHPETGRTPIRR